MVEEMLPRSMYKSREHAELGAFRSKTRLVVYDVPDTLTEETFIALFSIYGDIKSARICRGSRSSAAFGLVDYCTPEAARAARQGLDGFQLHEAKIRVLQADAVCEDWKLAAQPVDAGFNRPWSPREVQGKSKLWNAMIQDEGGEKEAFASLPDPTLTGVADAHGKSSEYTSNRKSPSPQVQQIKSVTSFQDSPVVPSQRVSLSPFNTSAPPAFVYNNKVQYLLVPNVYPVYPSPNFGLVSRPSSGHVFYAVPLYTNMMFPRLGVWPRFPQNVSVGSTSRAPWAPMYPLCGNIRSRLPGWIASAVPV